jgi:hypothetical protein
VGYLTPQQRMKVSLRREEVEATGKPLFPYYDDVPEGFVGKTKAQQMGKPVKENEQPVAYVLNRRWNGYLPLYDRRNGGK